MSTANPNIQSTESITYGYDALNCRSKVTKTLNGVTLLLSATVTPNRQFLPVLQS
jgi:hypothetical protein